MPSSLRRPKLGQHFLRDPRYVRKIVDALSVQPEDLMIEIGPGHGEITRILASKIHALTAIEIDPSLAARLRQEFRDSDKIEIFEGDILKADLGKICEHHKKKQCYVFGNLPYYITSPILHRLFAARARIRHMTVLVQREVAERITSKPGSRSYGYLSILAQCFSQPHIVLEIPPGAFEPPPKVYSALVDCRMVSRFPKWDDPSYTAFLNFARICFAQKRKNLLNNLLAVYSRHQARQALEESELKTNIRAEQLSLKQLANLFERLHLYPEFVN
jgi:16S rRNA (adenine1518-N6/adenine1519-N6)-dimethyltransferase